MPGFDRLFIMTPEVKICGLTTVEALDAALDAGADFVGFVHFPRSPRHLELEAMAALVAHVRARGSARSVTLLVDPDDALVERVAREVGPDFIQLHGDESIERVADIRQIAGRGLIKAVAVGTSAEVAAVLRYHAPGTRADILLLDAKPPSGAEIPGGNGLAFDWTILAALGEFRGYMLAGGLTPENVAEAIRITGAPMVDVSSGVESARGIKDPDRIRRFLQAAKAANH